MAAPLIDLVPLRFALSYSSDALTASLKPPTLEYFGAVAMSAFGDTPQVDHFVSSFRHNDYQAVSGDAVPLGTMAFNPRRLNVSTKALSTPGFAPWPGDMNDKPKILCEMAERGKNPELTARLRLAGYLPATRWPMTIWPLAGGKTIEVLASRISGGATLTELILWCMRLPKGAYTDACNLADRPHWVGKQVSLSESAGNTSEPEATIDPGDEWGLRLRGIFAGGYNASSGAHSETHLNAVAARIRLDDREIMPSPGQERYRLGHLYPESLNDFDHARDPRLVIPSKRKVRHELETLGSTGGPLIRFAHYGTVQRVHHAEGPKAA